MFHRKYFLFIFIFFISCISLKASNDSVVVYVCHEDDDGYSEETQTIYHYDALGNFVGYDSYTFDGSNNSNFSYTNIYEYDSLGRLTRSETSYDGSTYAYDSLNNIIEMISYTISGGVRNFQNRVLFTYNSHLLTQQITQNWNVNGTWQNSTRMDYFYDTVQNDSCNIEYGWVASSWTYASKKVSFYHSNNHFDFDSLFSWGPNDTTWRLTNIDTNSYNSLWSITENLTYVFNNGVRNFYDRNVYTYDSSNNQTSYSNDIWDIDTWTPISWGNSTYNAAGNMTGSDGGCLGCGYGESAYSYDSRGRLIHTSSYSVTHGGLENSSSCDVYYHLVNGPRSVCENSSIVLSADSGFVSYTWSTGEHTRSITVSQPGTYTVSMQDNLGYWNDAAPLNVTLSYGAVAPHTTDSTINACRGGQLINLTRDVNPDYSYQWIFNNDSIIQRAFLNGNKLYFLIYGSDASGCYRLVAKSGCDVDTSSKTCIYFSPDSLPKITATGGSMDSYGNPYICNNDTVTLTSSPGVAYQWLPNGETSQSIRVISSAQYSVIVSDSTGCYSYAYRSVYTSAFNYPTVLLPADSSIYFTPGYSQDTYGITWLFEGDTIQAFHDNTIPSPSPGHYQVIITYDGPCPMISYSNILYYNPDSLAVNAGYDQSVCYGSNFNFSLGNYVQIFHGTPPYTYKWTPAVGLYNPNTQYTNGLVDSLTPDHSYTYLLTVTDSTGRQASDSVVIKVNGIPPAPSITQLDSNIICRGQQYVRVELPPLQSSNSYYTTNIISGGCGANINNGIVYLQCGGTYNFYYYMNGCRSGNSAPVTVNEYPIPVNPVITSTGATSICYGDSIILTTSPLNNVHYQWLGYPATHSQPDYLSNADTNSISVFFGDAWRVTTIDSNGCMGYSNWFYETIDTSFQFLIQYDPPSVVCPGDSVKLWVDASPYPNCLLQWMKDGYKIPGANDSVFYANETGNYSLEIYPPADLCAGSSQKILIQIRPAPTLNILQNVNQLSAITNAWNYQWYEAGNLLPNETHRDLNINNNGIYAVKVMDYHGCSSTAQYVVNCGAILNIDNASCHGSCDGSITASPAGLPPFSYNWSTGSTLTSISNVCTGNYFLVVTDTLGCSDTLIATIADPPAIVAGVTIDSASCYSGCSVIHPAVSGGTAPYSYIWCSGSTSADLTRCSNGNCNLLVTDQHGCVSQVVNFTIAIPDSLSIQAVNESTTCIGCSNGSVQLQISGGSIPYSILWTPHTGNLSSNIITGLPAGIYSITVSDNNGCADSMNVFVADDPLYIAQNYLSSLVEIFPNPAHSTVTVKLNTPSQFFIFDSYGKLIINENILPGSREFDVSGFSKGIYLVKINSGDKMQLVRLVIE